MSSVKSLSDIQCSNEALLCVRTVDKQSGYQSKLAQCEDKYRSDFYLQPRQHFLDAIVLLKLYLIPFAYIQLYNIGTSLLFMDLELYLNISFAELETVLVDKWTSQCGMISMEEFIQWLGSGMKTCVEFIFHHAKLYCVEAKAKYAAVYYLFKYLIEKQVLGARNKNLEKDSKKEDFPMLCLACLQLSCKRYQSFSLSVTSLVKQTKGLFTKEEFFAAEMDIFKNLKYDINICTLFDYIELYLACFWTVVPKLLEVKVKELKHLCEDVTDLVYSNSAVLTMFNVKVLSCCIIAAASAIATGFPDRSGALVVWLSRICREEEKVIKEGANTLLSKLFEEKAKELMFTTNM